MPYPIIPGVPPVAGLAPGSTRRPFSLRNFAARVPEIVELQTDCFHMRSAFLIQSASPALPPAQPPATLITASTLSPPRAASTPWQTCASCSVQLALKLTSKLLSAAGFSARSTDRTQYPAALKVSTTTIPSPPLPPYTITLPGILIFLEKDHLVEKLTSN